MTMRLSRLVALGSLAVLGLVMAPARDARACGGCFVAAAEDTQVSQHKMILSVSMERTTLWDQIEYTGSAESFAWVLPIRGEVEVGLSSDLLFGFLERETLVWVRPPPTNCPVPAGCARPVSPRSTSGIAEDVDILAQEVVGPYETVQLSASEPGALLDWLAQHGYSIPEDIEPIIADYVEDGFGFLALKLVPGESVQAMRPVRVTSKGAGLSLPLRMVAAGTGAVTPMTLFVVGEGRYEAANFENFEISESSIVWDWDEGTSNYASVMKAGFEAREGKAWLTQWARPVDGEGIRNIIVSSAEMSPESSGYEGSPEQGITPAEEADSDVDELFGMLDAKSTWVTRLRADLSREALADDLLVSAAGSQEEVDGQLQAGLTIGDQPCPSYQCRAGDCAATPGPDATALGGCASVAVALALAACRRRRRTRRE